LSLLFLICRYLLALVFLFAAGGKGFDLVRFGRQIEAIMWSFGLNETAALHYLAHCVAGLVVGLELGLGAALLMARRRRFAAFTAIGLLFFFSLITLKGALSGAAEECGCFGMLWRRPPVFSLVENILFSVLGIFSLKDTSNPLRRLNRSLVAFGSILALFIIVNRWALIIPGAALQTGSKFVNTAGIILNNPNQSTALWFFDPECSYCLEQYDKHIITLAAQIPGRLRGLTKASPGRVDEFFIDYTPNFPITSADHRDWRRWGVPLGSIVIIKDKTIEEVRRAFEIPSGLEEIKRELSR